MFRIVCNHVFNSLLPRVSSKLLVNSPVMHVPRVHISKTPMDHHESWDDYVDRMECYFSRSEIDGWELRKGLNELAGMDLVPEPRVIIAALCACRRCNDYAATTRMLEMVKFKCGDKVNVLWPYLLKEIQPALCELGIQTPDEMGYGEPELWLEQFWDMNYVPKQRAIKPKK